jgi:hypothetical protein
MHQRQYRPGDVLDDYCPRERRITDHAIVAMVDSEIQLTRCVGCDAEHDYKNARVPPQRRKGTTAALFSQVLETMDAAPGRVAAPSEPPGDGEHDASGMASPPVRSWQATPAGGDDAGSSPDTTPAVPPSQTPADPPVETAEDRPFRRSLIRAQLPRPEGQPATPRAIPEFTMHQPLNNRGRRPGRFRRRPGQATDAGTGPMRFGRDPGQGQGQGQGHGGGRRRRRRKR